MNVGRISVLVVKEKKEEVTVGVLKGDFIINFIIQLKQ